MKIPRPVWIAEKHVFEFRSSPDVIAYLKLMRATQSLHALPVLCDRGLVADFGTSARAIIEAAEDALFLLERNPANAEKLRLFVEDFAATTIERAGESARQRVTRSKIQNAATRSIASIHGTTGQWGESEKKMERIARSDLECVVQLDSTRATPRS